MLYPTLQDRINAVTVALSPLPDGYFIDSDEESGSVLVCCNEPKPDGLGFCITVRAFEEGFLDNIEDRFAELVSAVEAAKRGAIVHHGAHTGTLQ